MEPALLKDYLQLYHCRTVSAHLLSQLMGRLGSVQTVKAELLEAGLLAEASLATAQTRRLIERDLAWCEHSDHHIICFEDRHYPNLLRQIDTPPPLLYVLGQKQCLHHQQLAIVGSRHATGYGRRHGFWLAHELAGAGLTLCSGLAKGIDTEVHRAALAASAATIAVLGTGVDRIYPAGNGELAREISAHGALVSEFALGTPPIACNFPRRNRIISGLTLGTVVIEASLRSGSLITARLALEQNREVFALPGPVSSSQSRGCHRLLQQGAKLIESPEDILEEIDYQDLSAGTGPAVKNCAAKQSKPGRQSQQTAPGDFKPSAAQLKIIKAMDQEQCLLDTLLERTGLPLPELTTGLLQLQAAGWIESAAGRYSRL